MLERDDFANPLQEWHAPISVSGSLSLMQGVGFSDGRSRCGLGGFRPVLFSSSAVTFNGRWSQPAQAIVTMLTPLLEGLDGVNRCRSARQLRPALSEPGCRTVQQDHEHPRRVDRTICRRCRHMARHVLIPFLRRSRQRSASPQRCEALGGRPSSETLSRQGRTDRQKPHSTGCSKMAASPTTSPSVRISIPNPAGSGGPACRVRFGTLKAWRRLIEQVESVSMAKSPVRAMVVPGAVSKLFASENAAGCDWKRNKGSTVRIRRTGATELHQKAAPGWTGSHRFDSQRILRLNTQGSRVKDLEHQIQG